MYAGEHYQQRGTGFGRSAEEIVEGGWARSDERGDALRMLGVGDALEQAIGGAQDRDSDFGAIDQRREAFMVAFAGFAEEDGLDRAAGAQRFFDQADAFDADAAGFGGQAAAQGDAKFLEPAIVAAGDGRGAGSVADAASAAVWRAWPWLGA